MRGLFGGEIELRDDVSLEPVPHETLATLRDASVREPLPELAAGAEVLFYDANDDGCVIYAKGLPPPLGSLAERRGAALEALARVASATGTLHAAGVSHGDLGLGPDTIRVGGDGVAILMPAKRPAPGALLAARLRRGEPLSAAAFSAPEVVTGYDTGPASDVYALAAMAHEIVSGHAPLGQIDFSEAMRGPFARLATLVKRGLAANPVERPSAEALARALHEAAGIANGVEAHARAAEPYRSAPVAKAPPRSPAEASAQNREVSRMSGILMLLLGVGALFVFIGAVWLVGATWGALHGGGRAALLVALTAGVLGAARMLRTKGYAGSGQALRVLGIELFWADGAYLLNVSDNLSDKGAWSLLAAAMTALAFVLAGTLESALFGALAALHAAIFAVLLGEHLGGDSPTGVAIYMLVVSLFASVLAALGHAWRRGPLGVPFASLAASAALASALVGLASSGTSDNRLFGTLWPYAVVVGAAAMALALSRSYAVLAALVTGILLALVPTAEALGCNELVYLAADVAIGFGVITAAFTWPRLAQSASTQTAWVVVGLASVATGPTLRFLVRCWDEDGWSALASSSGVYLGLIVAIVGGLVGASYVFGQRATRRLVYRLLEVTGLAMIFGAFTILSLARSRDSFYPLSILFAGAACFVVGATTRRATLVLAAAAALLINLTIQYFAKLWDVLPASMLVLVFGLALLVSGIVYERSLKHLIPQLRAWS